MILDAYHAAAGSVVLMDRSPWSRFLVTGPDRVKFLHNLVTNDIKRLAVGRGCEAFVTSPQGKTLGYVSVLVDEDRILLRTTRDGLESILPHLEKYGVFDDIELSDLSGRTFEYHLAGPKAVDLITRMDIPVPPEGELNHQPAKVLDRAVWVVRESPAGQSGVTLIGERDDSPLVDEVLRKAGESLGLRDLDESTFDVLRIEAGTPLFGRDVTPENLPQEVNRDARAINFVKGCYLGQETVARIDALGHVNKLLKGLRIEGPSVPPPGTALESEGKVVGKITSSAYSPGWNGPIALGYVRSTQANVGTTLECAGSGARQTATVVDFPMKSSTSS